MSAAASGGRGKRSRRTPPDPAREAALEVRLQVERGRRLDRAFDEVTRVRGLSPRDRRLAHEIAYGTTRMRGRLDHLISGPANRPMEKVSPVARESLRIGAYQGLFLGSVPEYAAVSSAVQLAKTRSKRAAPFVNAVLRAVLEIRDPKALFPSWARDPAGHLATWGSHPEWLVSRWLARWGPDVARRLVSINNRRPPVFLAPLLEGEANARRKLLGLLRERLGEELAENWRPLLAPSRLGCVELPPGVTPGEALEAVAGSIVQGPGARLAARYARLERGETVADLCAAPGGKAFALAALGARVLAFDRSPSRLRSVAEGAARLGLRLRIVAADAARPPLREVGAVLLDAPCTGTGTLARRPDLRWRLHPGSPAEMAKVQAGLLASAARLVTCGGVLVYATCTLEPEENERQMTRFLERHPGFVVERPAVPVPHGLVNDAGYLLARPDDTEADGAFAVRFRRVR